MRKLKDSQLKKHLRHKGVILDDREGRLLFGQHDYYQTVNAYKYLFISRQENIDDIFHRIDDTPNRSYDKIIAHYRDYFSISKHILPADLKEAICDSIIDRYELKYDNRSESTEFDRKVACIKDFNYRKYLYAPNTKYLDMVRISRLDHDLRIVMLKYILLIEKTIKRVFISVLNNDDDIQPGFLVDISNYDVALKQYPDTIESINMVIGMHSNRKSKPIKKKMDQKQTVPYWILINEMTMGQTLLTIAHLKETVRIHIYQALLNEMSPANYDIDDPTKTELEIQAEKEKIESFQTILNYLGDFRNSLAHNHPIYCFNIADFDPLSFTKPQGKPAKQHGFNAVSNNCLKDLYGIDDFNKRTTDVDINLAWIMYATKRIIDHLYPINHMGVEICDVYKKYNVFLSYGVEDIQNPSEVFDFLSEIEESNTISLQNDFDALQKALLDGLSYKRVSKRITKCISSMKNTASRLKKNWIKQSKYETFLRQREYEKYSGVGKQFLADFFK